MSKSKGNVIDPLELIDRYGADALRFTLAAMAAQGRDLRLAKARVEGYRNFGTKLWNAARFAELNGCVRVSGFDPSAVGETLNRWIAHELAKAIEDVTQGLEAFRFNEAAGAVYRFVWNVFCDWYLELAKPVLVGPQTAARTETQAMLAWTLDQILKLLHPFMPFITEELWGLTGESGPPRDSLLVLARWPQDPGLRDDEAEAEIGWVIDLVTTIRSVRMEISVPPAAQIPLVLVGPSPKVRDRAVRWQELIQRLARLSELRFSDLPPEGAVQLVVRGDVAALPLGGIVDFAVERERLSKELARLDAELARLESKLNNPDFRRRAPESIVEGERFKLEEARLRRAKILAATERLAGGDQGAAA